MVYLKISKLLSFVRRVNAMAINLLVLPWKMTLKCYYIHQLEEKVHLTQKGIYSQKHRIRYIFPI